MSVQEQELDELMRMLHPKMIGLFANIKAERDLCKARYECLKNLCGLGLGSNDHNWCELRGWDTVVICKYCATVDEAVDFVLGGNGDE